ncbi:TIM barrel protein [Rhabdobacter roseus]|uniref:Sugar phosphate isomerase/epimerase n=1 Tax=Rhabdobacter roseus TaxID=1655419 RepID=A0A840TIZ1_9BACT|nr:TIM barrel protein [Rhabdobacter roseus]MBB5282895.1 sugar phosphate isomerase/epimerase [Rhabdobacter roseus]
MPENNFPKLHNATWPGIVGKGSDSEPVIPFETLLEKTATAEVDGVKFDGVDIDLFDAHFSINSSDDDIKRLADQVAGYNLNIGSIVAPIWPPEGGSAMGSKEERAQFVEQVRKAARIGQKLTELGVRPSGVVRIDSASSPEAWLQDPGNNTLLIAQTFREAADAAAEYGERLAAEGEICWGGMHSWKAMLETLEAVDRPNVGFQADMAHTFLYLLGYNSPEDRLLPADVDLSNRDAMDEGFRKLTNALRPWTIDFHVAQNDGTVFGSGSHDKTGRHCLATDPNGKLDIAYHAGFWLRDENGELTKKMRHICWDGCMFPNEVMYKQETWNNILAAMIKVRQAHGWYEA